MRKKKLAPTQTSNEPTTGAMTEVFTPSMVLRSTNRNKKDVLTWRTSIIAAESVYFPNEVALQDLFTDIMLDAHLAGLVKKRISSVRNKKILWKVYDDDDKAHEQEIKKMDNLITSKVFSDVIKQAMLAKMFNKSGMEFIPGEKLAFNEIPRKHIKPKTQKIVYEQWDQDNGIFYPDYQNIWVIHEPGDLGLLAVCGFYALLKKGAISHWAEYVELYGSPTMVLKYGGNDLQSKKAGQEIINRSGNSMKICIPKEMDYQIVEGKGASGDGKLQETFIERLNQEMSMLILGNTETSTNGKGGTGGKSKVHSEEQAQLIKDDMDDILDLLNSDHFRRILATYGYPVDGGYFEYAGEVDIDFLERKLKVDLPLITSGLPVAASYIYKTYHIPEPEEGETLLVLSQPTEPPLPPKGRGKIPAAPKEPEATMSMEDMEKMFTRFFGNALT